METRQATRTIRRIASALLFLWLFESGAWLAGQQPPEANARSAVRILSPKQGEELNTNMVACKYELVQPASAAETPTFQLQLDDQDPLRTVMRDHTFTALKEGRHEIVIMVLDANNTPIPGTQAEVHFKVLPLPPPRSGSSEQRAGEQRTAPQHSAAGSHPRLLTAVAKVNTQAGQSPSQTTPVTASSPPQGQLPESGSPLPLLAVVCGGALAGGVISVLRTRSRRSRK